MNADIIVANAKVLTMDDAQPRAEAVAISGNEICFCGARDGALQLKGPQTRLIDAQGGTVMPGFIEGHMHLFAGAAELDHLQLFGVHGFDGLSLAVRDYAKERSEEPLLIAQGADYTILGERRVTRHDLDRIMPDRPFIMFAPDHHTAWANSPALEKAGILNGRHTGAGNEVVMADDGLAAGELREGEAFEPVMALSSSGNRHRIALTTGGEPDPPPAAAQFEYDLKTIKQGLAHCARHGITSIHNMDGNFYLMKLLETLEQRGELSCRARVPFHMKNFMPLDALDKASEMSRQYRSETLASGFVKVFVDGVLDSWTAVMIEDYADRPGWKGEPLFSPDHFRAVAVEADRRGLQIAVHAIGDGAVRIVLDGYEAARRENGARDSRHRIEHIEVIHPGDIPRFAQLGVIASMQPPHPPGCHGLPLEPTVSRIGPERWPHSYAWNSLREAGARLVFATDWPVSAIDPIRSVQSAMTRRAWRDDLPAHRQTLPQSLRSYTADSAYTEFMEDRKGKLKPGMLADLAVLSADLEITGPEAFHSVHPVVTICDGKVSFER